MLKYVREGKKTTANKMDNSRHEHYKLVLIKEFQGFESARTMYQLKNYI
jgi:hypothetical protein